MNLADTFLKPSSEDATVYLKCKLCGHLIDEWFSEPVDLIEVISVADEHECESLRAEHTAKDGE